MGILMEMRHYGVRRTHHRNIKLCKRICVLLFESCAVMGSGQISHKRVLCMVLFEDYLHMHIC